MEYKDYYAILSVDHTVNVEEIKKSYRKLARRYHPDINPGDAAARQRFAEIEEAHQVLTDPEARAKYDRLAMSWENHRGTMSDTPFDWTPWVAGHDPNNGSVDWDETLKQVKERASNFSDFYEVVFGALAEEQAKPTTGKGQDYHQQVEISLEEAYTGTIRILRVGDRRLEVRIPRGASTGTKVRVRGEGAEGPGGGPKGDLYLEIIIADHPTLSRMGDDLHTDLPVNLYSAILGGEAIVPTIKGKIKLRIPPETQTGRVFRLKGQGMPLLKNPDQRGDLYAKVVVTLPENLTEREIELFEELADIRGL